MKKQLLTFIIVFIVWLLFLIGGLQSNYYLDWSYSAKVWLSLFTFFLIIIFSYLILLVIWKEHFFKSSLWLAFHSSIPLAIYDYIYLVIIKGLDITYLFDYWYLTIFYFIVWIEIPLVGYILDKKFNRSTKA